MVILKRRILPLSLSSSFSHFRYYRIVHHNTVTNSTLMAAAAAAASSSSLPIYNELHFQPPSNPDTHYLFDSLSLRKFSSFSSIYTNTHLRKCLNYKCLPHLLRGDSEIIGVEDNRQTRLFNGGGAHHKGSSIGFPSDKCRLSDKIVVAVDVDEVLGNFVSALNKFIAERYSLNRSVSEYHVYEFFKIWNCSRDEADIRVHEFFKTPYFRTGIHPIPGARRALQKLSRYCNLSIVTSRQNAIKDHTIEWIEKHYPGLFQEIHFGNHFALDGQSRPKSDICRTLGAKVLIDDNPRYALECAEVGIRVLLFDYKNSYPWCKADSVHQHPLVTKVNDWEEVEDQLVSWIVS